MATVPDLQLILTAPSACTENSTIPPVLASSSSPKSCCTKSVAWQFRARPFAVSSAIRLRNVFEAVATSVEHPYARAVKAVAASSRPSGETQWRCSKPGRLSCEWAKNCVPKSSEYHVNSQKSLRCSRSVPPVENCVAIIRDIISPGLTSGQFWRIVPVLFLCIRLTLPIDTSCLFEIAARADRIVVAFDRFLCSSAMSGSRFITCDGCTMLFKRSYQTRGLNNKRRRHVLVVFPTDPTLLLPIPSNSTTHGTEEDYCKSTSNVLFFRTVLVTGLPWVSPCSCTLTSVPAPCATYGRSYICPVVVQSIGQIAPLGQMFPRYTLN